MLSMRDTWRQKRKSSMARFQLSKTEFKKLCDMVKQRDIELAETYCECIGEYPPRTNIEVHHHIHVGNFGADKEDNLISLSYTTHRFKAHGLNADIKKHMERNVEKYLNSPEVKKWREHHKEELEAIYQTEEEYRIKKLQKKHEVKKRYPWAKY
nr:MAG TPA: HNHc nucleases endonuclease signature which [Caudoviricetes sp.]